MPRFSFKNVDLVIERGNTRLPVAEAQLEVKVHDVAELPSGIKGSDLINGKYEVTGDLEIEFPASQNRLRPGMEGVLRITAPDGRITRLPVLILGMGEIKASPRGPGFRLYHWPVLGLARPAVDSVRLIPATSAAPLNLPSGEVSLEELIYQLAGSGAAQVEPTVRLNTEGGFET
jgi:hypothetical protein